MKSKKNKSLSKKIKTRISRVWDEKNEYSI